MATVSTSKKKKVVCPDDWDAWIAHLKKRKKPKPVGEVINSGKVSPLVWGYQSEIDQHAQVEIESLHKFTRQKKPDLRLVAELLENWLAEAHVEESEWQIDSALVALAWCHSLPRLALLGPDAWNQLLERLSQTALDATAISLETSPLVQQLLAGELALTLAYLFPELKSADDLRDSSSTILSVAADDLMDGRGLPTCELLTSMRPLLACWTRCGQLSRAAKTSCFSDRAQVQIEWLVRQAIRYSRGNGSPILGDAQKWEKPFLSSALELSTDPDDDTIADLALGSGPKEKELRPKLPESSYHSEWSESAILRSNWSRKSPSLAVTYAKGMLRGELNLGRETIWSGDWNPVLYINKEELRPQSDWDEICWYSDKDVDYVELEIEYSSTWKVQRQMLLAREDGFLIVADAVLGKQSARIDYASTLPIGDELGFDAASDTREGVLYRKKRLAMVLPLALPEWRSDVVDDGCSLTSNGLTLHQQNVGTSLYAPLWIDLKPSRFAKERTWRQLTVAEKLEIQPKDQAVGYRVQFGNQQWLLYRSLTERQSRTVLGKNFFCEFFLGRFLTSGETEELLQIE